MKNPYKEYYVERSRLEKEAYSLGCRKVIRQTTRRGEKFNSTTLGFWELPSGEIVRGIKKAIAKAVGQSHKGCTSLDRRVM